MKISKTDSPTSKKLSELLLRREGKVQSSVETPFLEWFDPSKMEDQLPALKKAIHTDDLTANTTKRNPLDSVGNESGFFGGVQLNARRNDPKRENVEQNQVGKEKSTIPLLNSKEKLDKKVEENIALVSKNANEEPSLVTFEQEVQSALTSPLNDSRNLLKEDAKIPTNNIQELTSSPVLLEETAPQEVASPKENSPQSDHILDPHQVAALAEDVKAPLEQEQQVSSSSPEEATDEDSSIKPLEQEANPAESTSVKKDSNQNNQDDPSQQDQPGGELFPSPLTIPTLSLKGVSEPRNEKEIGKSNGAIKSDLIDSATAGEGSRSSSALTSLSTSSNVNEGSHLKKLGLLTPQGESKLVERIDKILKAVSESQDGTSLSFRLDPPELGTVTVDISFVRGELHARLVADSPEVTELLRDKGADLQASLRKAGIVADTIVVSIKGDSSSQFQGFGNNQQGSQQRKDLPHQALVPLDEGLVSGGETLRRLKKVRVGLDSWVA